MKSLVLAALLIAASQAAGAADAADLSGEFAQQVVRYAELDLTRPAGVAILYKRINTAAFEVCEPDGVWAVATVPSVRRCVDAAVARAVADVNAPALTDYHVGRTTRHLSADASQTPRREPKASGGTGGGE